MSIFTRNSDAELEGLRKRMKALEDDNLRLFSANNRLTDLNNDLNAQCQELRKAKPMTEVERQEIDRKMAEHMRLVQEQANIVVFLRDNMPDALKGEFSNLPFDKFIIKLLESK